MVKYKLRSRTYTYVLRNAPSGNIEGFQREEDEPKYFENESHDKENKNTDNNGNVRAVDNPRGEADGNIIELGNTGYKGVFKFHDWKYDVWIKKQKASETSENNRVEINGQRPGEDDENRIFVGSFETVRAISLRTISLDIEPLFCVLRVEQTLCCLRITFDF